jgi:hypothetical protein
MSTPASMIGAAVVCAASFGAGLVLMNRNQDSAEETPPPAPAVAETETTAPAESKPAIVKKPQSGASDGGIMSVESDSVATAQPQPANPSQSITIGDQTYSTEWMNSMAESMRPIGPWRDRSGLGIANPRLLTDREKKALNLLGKAVAVHSVSYRRSVLNDGSTVPGVPQMSAEEVKRLLLTKTATKGMGAGFEEFMREIAIQNPSHFEIQISNEANWSDLENVLNGVKTVNGPKTAMRMPFVWYSIGDVDAGDWLSFGVSGGKVRLVRAEFPFMVMFKPNTRPEDAPLIPAELVPGGRSEPNPARAKKK